MGDFSVFGWMFHCPLKLTTIARSKSWNTGIGLLNNYEETAQFIRRKKKQFVQSNGRIKNPRKLRSSTSLLEKIVQT